jgi:hypothetical protein
MRHLSSNHRYPCLPLLFAVLAVAVGILSATGALAQDPVTFFDFGFEEGEGNDVFNGSSFWPAGLGGKIHGVDTYAGNFSIPSENHRWLTDTGNARSGAQSARLRFDDHEDPEENLHANYNFFLNPPTREAMDNSNRPIRISYSNYRAKTFEDLRMNGFKQATNQGEMWQWRIANDGDISLEHGDDEGGSNKSNNNPGNLVGWYDFQLDVDFGDDVATDPSMIIGARYREPGAVTFTDLLTEPVPFKPSGADASNVHQIAFRADNFTASGETAWDDFSMVEIGLPSPDFTWTGDGSGLWNTSGGIYWNSDDSPNSPDHTVTFSGAAAGPSTVVVDVPTTVNKITFDNENHSYAIGGLGSVTVAESSAQEGPRIDVNSGHHQFQTELVLSAETTVTVASGASLTFNNQLDLGGNNLLKVGDGNLAVNNILSSGNGTIQCLGGTCSGSGTVSGSLVNNGGVVSPGTLAAALGNSTAAVPEPASLVLLIAGLLPLAIRRRPGS